MKILTILLALKKEILAKGTFGLGPDFRDRFELLDEIWLKWIGRCGAHLLLKQP